MELEFVGPYHWSESTKTDLGRQSPKLGDYASQSGIYLWTVPVNGFERVFCVGRAKKLQAGLNRIIPTYLSGEFGIYDTPMLCEGKISPVYSGLWNVKGDEKIEIQKKFRRERGKLYPLAAENLDASRIWIALIDEKTAVWAKTGIYHAIKRRCRDKDVRNFLITLDSHQLRHRAQKSTEINIVSNVSFEGLPDKIMV